MQTEYFIKVALVMAAMYITYKIFMSREKYYATVQRSDFGRKSLKNIIKEYFNNSYTTAVSALVDDGELSSDEIKDLLQQIENQNAQS